MSQKTKKTRLRKNNKGTNKLKIVRLGAFSGEMYGSIYDSNKTIAMIELSKNKIRSKRDFDFFFIKHSFTFPV